MQAHKSTKSILFLFLVFFIQNKVFAQDDLILSREINAITCNNWLRTLDPGDCIKAGNIKVTGNKVTVEALINRTEPYFGGFKYGGDIVSKHTDPATVNYLLRSNNAEITTSNGYFSTNSICEISLNKTYHVALVYDGTTLKFYRNGFLMSQVPASGNLIQNNFITTIGDWAQYTAPIGTSFKGYINEVRIWNVARTQTELRTYMGTSLPNPTTQTGLLAYYTFENLVNKQGNTLFNGILMQNATINNSNTNCNFIPDSCGCNLNFDFYYDYDPCSPLSVKFHGTGTDISNPKWIFDDGSTITGNLSPVKTFTSEGLHTVKYIVSNSGCSDTIVKTINVKVYPENIILTPNSTICKGSSILLNTSVALDFCWNPSTFLDNPLSPTPIASPTHDITYYFSSLETATNLIANGNFESGNTGFNSEYLYNPSSGFNGGVYTVSSNILAWHPGMVGCVDHTSGSGKMLLVNGSSDVGAKVWSKTIPVTPNTDYNFSTWLQNISFLNPAQLQFQINGSQIGPVFTANNASCVWEQFNASWNSGSATSANISITNQNSVFSGNDFALDDIVFATVKIKRDSVVIKVDNPVVKSINDSTICEGASLTLLTSGAATYNWTPASGLNNVNSASPVATPTVSSQYIVTGTTTAGCIAKDTVNITVKPKPVIKTIADSTFCGPRSVVLSTTGGNTYSWSPAAGLSNPNIANPTFTGTTPQQYVYYVTGTAANGCSAKDTVKLKLNEQPVVSTISDASICEGDALQLTTSSTAQNHSWSPATAVSNANSVSPMFTATSNQTLIITGTTTAGCIAKDTVNITVKSKPTVKTIPDTTICGTANITLTTTGGNSYSWSPATFLNNPSIANPVFTGNASTLYIVTGTGLNGCSAKDSVQVNVFSKPTFNAPQNKSVCLGNSVQLSGNNGSGFSYSWSPASSLSNTNIEAPFANPATTTNFSVKITDNNCMYDSTFVVVVTVNPRPVIKASKSNDIDCSHPRSNLNASGGTSYVWSPATYLNNSNIGNPVASPTSTIKYVVTGTDINGCSNKDSVTVLLKGLSNFNFVIPNSFTPNNDNLNDCFSLKYWGKMDNFTLKIYNRWGELVFETNDNSVCWDGKYKGKQCEKGNYVYYVRGSSSCGSVNKKGNLLLIR